ncbi:MAG TPA: M4 family peptidase, partial [Dermatophilaceae bacterium]
MNRLRTGLVFGALVAMIAATSQGVAAFGAAPPSPDRASGIATERAASAASAAAGRALGLGTGEKLVVRDVITDTDGSTHVRYDRTFDGLRVIGGDLVSHRDSAGAIQSVSWNASHSASVASKTPQVSLALAEAAGAGNAASVQQSTTANHGELVVFAGGATPKLAYDVLTEGMRADQTPSRLHTIVDATMGAILESFDEVENGTGNGIF